VRIEVTVAGASEPVMEVGEAVVRPRYRRRSEALIAIARPRRHKQASGRASVASLAVTKQLRGRRAAPNRHHSAMSESACHLTTGPRR
jgi:hypothetical protein